MGVPTILAGAALLLAAGLLIVFFITENETADKASNWFFSVFYVLMGWTVIEVHRLYADTVTWMWVLTIVALAVLAVLLVSTLLVVTGRIDFTKIALVTTLAFVVLLLWMLAVSILIVTKGGLPSALGWLGIGIMTVSALVVGALATDRGLIMGEKTPGPALNALFGVILAGLTVWIIWLGIGPTSAF